MSSSISSIGSYGTMMAQGMGRRQPPSSSEMAEDLFSKIDSTGKGYIEQSDLEAALEQIQGSQDSASASDVFASLDADSDGKVTQEEMTSGFDKLAQALEGQFQQSRMSDAMGGMGGMPPPPPPSKDDAGFTQDELESQLEEIGDSDSDRASLISNVIENFDEADTDGDGKVSFQEAMAYDQSSTATDSTESDSTTTATSSTSSSEAKIMQTIMQLVQAYRSYNSEEDSSSVSVTA